MTARLPKDNLDGVLALRMTSPAAQDVEITTDNLKGVTMVGAHVLGIWVQGARLWKRGVSRQFAEFMVLPKAWKDQVISFHKIAIIGMQICNESGARLAAVFS
jgi:hypothetical protein